MYRLEKSDDPGRSGEIVVVFAAPGSTFVEQKLMLDNEAFFFGAHAAVRIGKRAELRISQTPEGLKAAATLVTRLNDERKAYAMGDGYGEEQ
jgi:hypothetical protein